MLCTFLQKYTGITQDNRVADAARWVPASATPSPSLWQSHTPVSLLSSACHKAVEKRPALPFAADAYKSRNGMHWVAVSHAHQQHNTNYDLDGSKQDSTWGHVDQCQCCPTCAKDLTT